MIRETLIKEIFTEIKDEVTLIEIINGSVIIEIINGSVIIEIINGSVNIEIINGSVNTNIGIEIIIGIGPGMINGGRRGIRGKKKLSFAKKNERGGYEIKRGTIVKIGGDISLWNL